VWVRACVGVGSCARKRVCVNEYVYARTKQSKGNIVMSEKPTIFGVSSVEILLSLLEILLIHSRSYDLSSC
jgi:hypothetical protein